MWNHYGAVPLLLGIIAVKWLVSYLQSHGLAVFGWHRIILGLAVGGWRLWPAP
ncbi:MAG: hypothetical protein WCS43_02315 [Verrucomicrobiota bacterium]